ncbi:MAG TPA: glycine cleavage T C-terminal barrel domain-containing protein [Bryobacteraceae bacterium]|nr:glycine cleavage T C-terminal barrel domain-containing protein [Bryobacteraceae bacterium]
MTNGYEALRNGVAWLDLSARGRFRVRGRDRARYLHNVTSNEVKKMTPGMGCYAFVLTPQGRIQADLHLFCFAEHFLVDTEPELRGKLPALILKYKVADQVEIEDITEETAAFGIEGPAAPARRDAFANRPDFTVVDATLTGQPGFRVICATEKSAQLISIAESAGARAAGAEDARAVRIENGKPRYGEDIRETSLPQETQQLDAVSFTKGCYVGQEIVERIRAQGHVNKLLVRLEVESAEPPAPGSRLAADGNEAGEITSSIRSPQSGCVAALAIVRAAYAKSGTRLQAGALSARVV